MAVHRISDRADLLLQRMAAADRKKPGQFLSDLILAYAAGLSFENDPNLDKIPAPEPEKPIAGPELEGPAPTDDPAASLEKG